MLQFKKSKASDFSNYNMIGKLDLILTEQRNQRLDLSVINSLIKKLIVDSGTQKQVDDFYESEDTKNIPEEEQ